MSITIQQLKKRIQHKMEDYYRANVGPVSMPRATRNVTLPQRANLNELMGQTENSKEALVINLQTIKACFNEQEQEIIKYRLMGYEAKDIGTIMRLATQTIYNKLDHIVKVGKEVNNV